MSSGAARSPSGAGEPAPVSEVATRASRLGRWPALLVAVALLALAFLPILQESRLARIESDLTEVLEPAGRLSDRLALLHARQMARFQAWMLTGEARFRARYGGLVAEEAQVLEELRGLVDRTGLDVREPLVGLSTAAQDWRLAHELALSDEAGRQAYLSLMANEQERYDRVLAAAEQLQEAIYERQRRGRARVERARTMERWLTVGLALVALAAAGVLFGVSRRLRTLVQASEARRVESLRARREMLAVLEATGDGVLGLDLEGRCTFLNQTGTDLLGYTEVDAQGRDVHALVHGRAPDERQHPPEACPILQAVRSGASERGGDDTLWRRNGTSFPARWSVRPLLDGRVLRGAVLTITDTTEVRAAERALRRAVKARDEVVAVVSHDLRNPVGTISAAAELITELDLRPEQEREQLRIIQRASRRMIRLIEDLLDVARIEAGGLSVELAPTEAGSAIAEAVESVQHLAEQQGVRVGVELAPDLPPVRADRDRLVQVLGNLLANAVKFTDEGGRVTVFADLARVRVEEAEEERVRLVVSDTGRGMPPEALDHLFDRFWQVERTDSRGAGLGLAIVKGIVDAHHGRIEVESEPGVGTSFRVYLLRA